MKNLNELSREELISLLEKNLNISKRKNTYVSKIEQLKLARGKQREILKPIQEILDKAEVYRLECNEIMEYFRTQKLRGLIYSDDLQKLSDYVYGDKEDLELLDVETYITDKKGKAKATIKIK